MANILSALDRGETAQAPDQLVPDPQVMRELGITAMSMWRWDHDPELIKLGWPPAIYIRKRKFRSRRALEDFKAAMARRAIEQRGRLETESVMRPRRT